MKLRNFLIFSIGLLFSVIFVNTLLAQQPLPPHVLFESFTNSAEPCPDPNRAPFENAVVSEATGSGASKIVYLNYHVSNLADELAQLDQNGQQVDERLTGITSTQAIYTCAVNRSTFPEDGQRVDPPTTGTGQYSDWGTEINNDYTTSPEASITFNYATLDKTNSQSYQLHVDVTVTANTQISDSLIIRYAIAQDNVKYTECDTKTSSTMNNVVWSVTTQNTSKYIVCTSAAGLSAGDTVHLTWDELIDMSDPTYEDAANMKVIAFLEDDGGGDYNVVNADILRQDIDTLQPPPPTLALAESFIDDKTFSPGSEIPIYFSSTNLVGGVNAFYSLNNGSTWGLIGNNQSNPISWLVPDSLTTQGKFKVVAANYPTLISIQDGNFTIANPASATILKPQPAQVITAGSSDTIIWTKNVIDSVTLEYYLADANGGFSTPHVLGTNLTDTFFYWSVPDTTRIVEIKLVPVSGEAPAASVVDTIEKQVVQGGSSVASSSQPTGLSITNVFPNPASNGQEIVVQYTEAVAKPITVQLLDLLGRVMPESYTTDNQAIHLNTNSLAAGAYVVRLSDGTNTVSKRVEIIR
jgi:Secretion system C-terminal sorting domain